MVMGMYMGMPSTWECKTFPIACYVSVYTLHVLVPVQFSNYGCISHEFIFTNDYRVCANKHIL